MIIKTKVLAYIYRFNQTEILVFDQDDPLAGTQVVCGTVDSGEDLITALLREIKEESGLQFLSHDIVKKVGETQYLRKDKPELNLRHFYQFEGDHLPEKWNHIVLSDGEDNGFQFHFYWLTCSVARSRLAGEMGQLLP